MCKVGNLMRLVWKCIKIRRCQQYFVFWCKLQQSHCKTSAPRKLVHQVSQNTSPLICCNSRTWPEREAWIFTRCEQWRNNWISTGYPVRKRYMKAIRQSDKPMTIWFSRNSRDWNDKPTQSKMEYESDKSNLASFKCNPSARHWKAVIRARFKCRDFIQVPIVLIQAPKQKPGKIIFSWVSQNEQNPPLTSNKINYNRV